MVYGSNRNAGNSEKPPFVIFRKSIPNFLGNLQRKAGFFINFAALPGFLDNISHDFYCFGLDDSSSLIYYDMCWFDIKIKTFFIIKSFWRKA
ncbi:Uncharacterised protein [Candidatus Anstonella stagnisolia]|nr:Uncharacterised protein [Candidatus Anstonella stagnisolia]